MSRCPGRASGHPGEHARRPPVLSPVRARTIPRQDQDGARHRARIGITRGHGGNRSAGQPTRRARRGAMPRQPSPPPRSKRCRARPATAPESAVSLACQRPQFPDTPAALRSRIGTMHAPYHRACGAQVVSGIAPMAGRPAARRAGRRPRACCKNDPVLTFLIAPPGCFCRNGCRLVRYNHSLRERRWNSNR